MKQVTVTMTVTVRLEIPDGFEGKCTEDDLIEMAASAVNDGHEEQAVQVTVESVGQFNPEQSEDPEDAVFAQAFVEADKDDVRISDVPEE
jgi:hypothetical protein